MNSTEKSMTSMKHYTTMTFLNVKAMTNCFNTLNLNKFDQTKPCYLHFAAPTSAYYVVEIKIKNITFLPNVINGITNLYPNNTCDMQLPTLS